ncbi:MAG: 8-amino-7-oxononanoate synthase [Nitrospiraceae bacterium]
MFEQYLHQLTEQHLRRHIRPLQSGTGSVVTVDGRATILMASNNYLGLATHPAVKQAAIEATERFGVGSGASRLVSGTLPPHEELEASLARFKRTEAALVFSSGYMANVGMIPSLMGRGGLILADRLCHASLIDGCRLSGADFRVFRHRDMAHLERLLAKRPQDRVTLIVTDGIFSMDGDAAPLPELANLADRFHAQILVDDAHGTGVMGYEGRGTLEHFGVESRVPFHMGTLSKALGTSGAYVAGPASLIQFLVNTVRSFIYTTALPPANAAASAAALKVLQAEPARRARLWDNRRYFCDGLHALGFEITDTLSPIIPVLIGDAQKTLTMADRILQLGVYAPAIRPPTVPRETSRIRTTVTSEHTREQLDQVLAAFGQAGRELGVI